MRLDSTYARRDEAYVPPGEDRRTGDILDILAACGWTERNTINSRPHRFLQRYGTEATAFLNDATDPCAVLDWFRSRMLAIEEASK